MDADDDFDAGIVADVLFGLVETEAGDEDFFIIRYDEVFVPGVCNVRLAFGIGRSDRDDAIAFDLIQLKKTLVNMGIPPLAKKDYVHYSKREMYTIVSYDGVCKKISTRG